MSHQRDLLAKVACSDVVQHVQHPLVQHQQTFTAVGRRPVRVPVMPARGICGMRLFDFFPGQTFESTIVTFAQWQYAADFQRVV